MPKSVGTLVSEAEAEFDRYWENSHHPIFPENFAVFAKNAFLAGTTFGFNMSAQIYKKKIEVDHQEFCRGGQI